MYSPILTNEVLNDINSMLLPTIDKIYVAGQNEIEKVYFKKFKLYKVKYNNSDNFKSFFPKIVDWNGKKVITFGMNQGDHFNMFFFPLQNPIPVAVFLVAIPVTIGLGIWLIDEIEDLTKSMYLLLVLSIVLLYLWKKKSI
jgi:hypothetical protein